MLKTKYQIAKVAILATVFILLSACGGTKHFITPLNKNIAGNVHVVDISVITKSKPLTHKLKKAVLEETIKRLKGSHEVKLKIDVTNWQPAYNFEGVKTGSQRTTLAMLVTVLDAKTNAVVGKYNTSSFYHNDLNVTASGKNTNEHVIDTAAYFTAWQLEK